MLEESAAQSVPPPSRRRVIGRRLATAGAAMFAFSIIAGVFLGIGGATFHNIMQLGGVAIALVGVVMMRWKGTKG